MEFWSLLFQGLRLSWGIPCSLVGPVASQVKKLDISRDFYPFVHSLTHSFDVARTGCSPLGKVTRLSLLHCELLNL